MAQKMRSERVKRALELLGVKEGQTEVSEQKASDLPTVEPKPEPQAGQWPTFGDCPLCKDRHAIGQPCPEKSTDWMNIEGNRVVSAVSDQLNTWGLTSLKHPILEAIERFDEAWDKRDDTAFKAVVSEIDRLLIEACRKEKGKINE